MMNTYAPSPAGIAFGMLHGIGALLFVVGTVLLLVWAIKALHVGQLKRWGIGFIVAALVLSALSAVGGAAMWHGMGGIGGFGMMGAPGMRERIDMRMMDNRERTIALTALPTAVQDAIKVKYPSAMMMQATETTTEDGTMYDIELKSGGTMMGVVFGEDGTFIGAEDYSDDAECGAGSGTSTSCTQLKRGMMDRDGMMMERDDMMMGDEDDEDDSRDTEMNPMDMSMEDMSEMLAGKTGDDFDKAFLLGMIPHHQGAIDMANAALKNAKHEEIKTLATAIIASQQKEIDEMKAWLKTWGYEK